MAEPLKVEYISIDKITPYAGNAKLHPEQQIEQIKKSIQEFGFNDPLALWNGEVVEGHGRLIAAKQLGMKEVPVIRLDELTDEQRRAYALVHNKLTMITGFDIDYLNEELSKITDIQMNDYGLETIETVGRDVDDFFNTEDPRPEPQEKNHVMFTVKPQDKREDLISYLKQEGVKYDEY